MHQAGVDVHLSKAATTEVIAAEHPDAVVVATGGGHDIAKIYGIDGKDVLTAAELHDKVKILLRAVPPMTLRKLHSLPVARDVMIGKRVVIMGGRLQGAQTAKYLVDLGKDVTIVDEGTAEEIGEGLLEVFLKPYLLWWLEDSGVRFITDAKYRRVTDRHHRAPADPRLIVDAIADGARVGHAL